MTFLFNCVLRPSLGFGSLETVSGTQEYFYTIPWAPDRMVSLLGARHLQVLTDPDGRGGGRGVAASDTVLITEAGCGAFLSSPICLVVALYHRRPHSHIVAR